MKINSIKHSKYLGKKLHTINRRCEAVSTHLGTKGVNVGIYLLLFFTSLIASLYLSFNWSK